MSSVQGSPSVLIVDDNPLIANVLTSLLRSEKYNVRSAMNGEEALEVLDEGMSDVIICDVMMPQLDGFGFFQEVRKNPEYAHIPFIFLTALGEQKDIEDGIESGADDYLVKPFDPKYLLSLVKGKVARSKCIKSQTSEANDHFRKRIIHTLSHEFRTPLVAINTGTELLIERNTPIEQDKARSLLEAIQRGGQRLEKLVNDFMLMQQVEAGIAARLFETRSVEETLSEVLKEFFEVKGKIIGEQGFQFSVQDFSKTVRCKVYTPQIQEMVWRLLENAMKFSHEKKEIEVVLTPRDGAVGIEIRDRGIGVNLSELGAALDTFGQLNREKLEQQGGGLGLALVKRYAEIHGGEVTLEPRDGGGSVARITIPAIQ